MKIRKEITINADRRTVWQNFNDSESMRRWQPTLVSQVHKQGVDGEPGAVYELVYDHGGREIRVVSTVIEKREYERTKITADSKSSFATIVSCFEIVTDSQTRWVFCLHYRFKGWYRIAALFARNSMQARADEEMRRFKLLVESQA